MKNRKERLEAFWRTVPKDYRSGRGRSRKVLMWIPTIGTCLVPLNSVTNEQIEARRNGMLENDGAE